MATARDLLAFLNAESTALCADPAALDAEVGGPAPLGEAGAGQFSFCGPTAKDPAGALAATGATLVVVDAAILEEVKAQGGAGHVPVLVPSANARLDFIRLVERFCARPPAAGVHPSAIVDPTARVHPTASIGALCSVGEGCEVGEGTVLHAGVHLYHGVRVGARVIIHSGTVVGADGFGYERDASGALVKFPHVGGVVIEDEAEIGANTCIDRGTLGDTRIGRRARVDNLVHIAHNVQVGADAAVIALAMVGGSTTVAERAWVAPSAVLRDRIRIGAGAVVGLGAVVTRDVPDGATVLGNPARDLAETKALQGAFKRLLQETPAQPGRSAGEG